MLLSYPKSLYKNKKEKPKKTTKINMYLTYIIYELL